MTEAAAVMALEEVRLCPWRMQVCNRGESLCPVGVVGMGSDEWEVGAQAADYWFAGNELPPYFYRNLKHGERKRYGSDLARKAR